MHSRSAICRPSYSSICMFKSYFILLLHDSAEAELQGPSEDAVGTARNAAERESDQGHLHSSVQPKVGVHVCKVQYNIANFTVAWHA